MKRIVKTFTFWFVFLGIAIVLFNLLNYDDMSIVMIGLNPILNILSGSSLCSTIADIPYLWHILSLSTMTLYGLVLDSLKAALKNNK